MSLNPQSLPLFCSPPLFSPKALDPLLCYPPDAPDAGSSEVTSRPPPPPWSGASRFPGIFPLRSIFCSKKRYHTYPRISFSVFLSIPHPLPPISALGVSLGVHEYTTHHKTKTINAISRYFQLSRLRRLDHTPRPDNTRSPRREAMKAASPPPPPPPPRYSYQYHSHCCPPPHPFGPRRRPC